VATNKTIQDSCVVQGLSPLTCDICNSSDIAEATAGYVCRNCGIVLQVWKLQYDRPYNADLVQYAIGIGTTQIGTRKERVISPNSRGLNRLSKYNYVINNDKIVYARARREFSRVLSRLGLGEYKSTKEIALVNFKEIRAQLRPGSKYRNVEKLVAIILYFRFRLDGISTNMTDFFNETELTKKEFNDFFTQIRVYFPEYLERDRKDYISQRILEVCEHFKLGMPFYHLSKKILHKLWEVVKGTTDDVLAGLVCSISGLCAFKGKISVNAICKQLGISMSTIQVQVKRKILEHFKVDGFVSLVRSSDLLERILERLGLVERQESNVKDDIEESDIVEIKLGNAVPVFNSHNRFDYYCFAIRGEEHSQVNICLKINHNPLDYTLANPSKGKKKKKRKKIRRKKKDFFFLFTPLNLIDFQIFKYKYPPSKDPPLIIR